MMRRQIIQYIFVLAVSLCSLPLFSQIPEVITEEWLQDHMRFGPEVTFTNEILFELPNPPLPKFDRSIRFNRRNLKRLCTGVLTETTVYTQVQIQEVIRFLEDVLKVKSGQLDLRSYSELFDPTEMLGLREASYLVHRQPVTFSVVLPNGRSATLTIEHGAIEVNQSPQAINEIRPTWARIFRRAKAHGYQGNMYFASGGGRGHVHLGFDSFKNNLFMARPLLLQRLIILPLIYPGMIYHLHDQSDFGPDSTIETPYGDGAEKQRDFLRFLWSIFTNQDMSPHVFNTWLGINLPEALKNHDSFLSFKNINSDNPRVEVRFQRGYATLSDVTTIAHFWLRSLLVLVNAKVSDFIPPDFSEHPYEKRPSELSADFKHWMKRIGLSRHHQEALWNFGGDDLRGSIPLVSTPDSKLQDIKASPFISTPEHPSNIEVLLPYPREALSRPLFVKINGHIEPTSQVAQGGSIRRPYFSVSVKASYHEPTYHLITYTYYAKGYSNEDQTETVLLKFEYDEDTGWRMSATRKPANVIKTPEQLRQLLVSGGLPRWVTLKRNLRDAGFGERRFSQLARKIHPNRKMTIGWMITNTDALYQDIADISQVALNGQEIPFRRIHLGHSDLFVSEGIEMRNELFGFFMTATKSTGEIVAVTFIDIIPFENHGINYMSVSEIKQRDDPIPFDPLIMKYLKPILLGGAFQKKLFRDTLLKYWFISSPSAESRRATRFARSFEKSLTTCN
jgi:hypothetical protein